MGAGRPFRVTTTNSEPIAVGFAEYLKQNP